MNTKLNRSEWHRSIYSSRWTSEGVNSLEVMEPATGELLDIVGLASKHHVYEAAEAAVSVQRRWADTAPGTRAAILRRAAALFEERKPEILEILMRESGSIMPKAEFEFASVISELHEAAALTTQPEGLLLPSGSPTRLSIARRVPIGVVGVITPWNLPLALAVRSIAPAVALGNAVILKPDPKTPISGGLIIAQIFQDAGLPAGVLSVLPGGAEVGDAIVRHPDIPMISFTGSTATGKMIARIAGESLKKVSLELGGNNALIVLDDADLERATSAAAYGSFLHQGQVCVAVGRHIVHRKIAAQYAEMLASRAKNLPVGDPYRENVALGPIISQQQIEKIDEFVKSTATAGARLLTGGKYDKLFYQPTVLTDVLPGMPTFDYEVFGPVASITVFDDDEQAVDLANRGDYGLSSAVQSRSLDRAMAISRGIKAGMVHVNDQTIVYEAHAPFGGVKNSGNGSRYGSPTNHEEFTTLQWVTTNEVIPTYPF
ncbi:aldehyde dehydrogenase family protein [Paraburkholderia sp. J7]|uniref:aldehyde dehydrogenase family protein n=1 Tax=Paraburkholderia sp. J7 TaxID=2805438 RepID=UPI002AB6B82B|nr:aldehyde dehydrogenase family protein [Paraburkholderia sp. J7]